MEFTTYYSKIINIQGQQPNLNFEQHKRLFNIVALEMRLDELKRFETLKNEPDWQRKLFARQQSLKEQLRPLIKHEVAAHVLEEMIETSQRY